SSLALRHTLRTCQLYLQTSAASPDRHPMEIHVCGMTNRDRVAIRASQMNARSAWNCNPSRRRPRASAGCGRCLMERDEYFILSLGSPRLLRDVLSLDVALDDRSVVRRHVSIELTNLGRLRAVPGAVNFRENCIGRRGDDTTLDQARQCRPV